MERERGTVKAGIKEVDNFKRDLFNWSRQAIGTHVTHVADCFCFSFSDNKEEDEDSLLSQCIKDLYAHTRA